MWNPYNLALNASPLVFGIPKPLPSALKYRVGTVINQKFMSVTGGSVNNTPALGADSLSYRIPAGFTLKPGETRIFSPASETPAASGSLIDLSPGYRSRGGYYYTLKKDDGTNIYALPTDTIQADAKFDTEAFQVVTSNGVSSGVGIYLDMVVNGSWDLAYRMVLTQAAANAAYPPINNMATSPALSNLTTNPSPFMTTVFGARMASKTHIPAKAPSPSAPMGMRATRTAISSQSPSAKPWSAAAVNTSTRRMPPISSPTRHRRRTAPSAAALQSSPSAGFHPAKSRIPLQS